VVRRENTVDILGVGNERFWAQGRPLWHATTETEMYCACFFTE